SMSTLLDTNVLSELLRRQPAPAVLAWFAEQPPESLFVSAVTQAEMMVGARLLSAGKRRKALEMALVAMFSEDFAGRILPFDSAAV
ncbi:PIN domain-containing protein, partial [Acinetobacter baumannii]